MALAAVTNGDNSNILVARVARETFGIEHVVARIYDPRRAAIYQRLGMTTVATVAWTTDQVLRRLLPTETPAEWTDPSASVSLVERAVPQQWAGHPLGELEEHIGGKVVAVGRLGKAHRADARHRGAARRPALRGSHHGQPGRRWTRRWPRRQPDGIEVDVMRVVIAGGGSVGRFIAEQLHAAKHDVLIVDNDPKVVKHHVRSNDPVGVAVAGGRRVRGRRARRRRGERGRRGRRGHGGRRGQPRHLAAGQAGVRRARGSWPA